MFANIMRKYVKNPVKNFRLKFVLLIRLFFDNLDVNCGDFRGLVSGTQEMGIEVYREFVKSTLGVKIVLINLTRYLHYKPWKNMREAYDGCQSYCCH
ncbi:hypothetical protein MKW98_004989 [Papaver atlanticum]|uniref:Uncharacterized protein n=1 Tax=Papaver atlanticum TaxID=357466 RepID=A0AAD4XTQ6_9MAGN|nr:hypothetical protein MKW98_004989 [Papaver atlanticum]